MEHNLLTMKRSNKLKRTRKDYQLHLLVLPAVVLALLFSYSPMFGLVIAFQNFKPARGFFRSDFIGLENFKVLFSSSDIYQIIFNTLFFALTKIVILLLVPFVFALLLNEINRMYFKRTIQTLVYLPHFMSWVILGGILVDMLRLDGGFINQIIQMVGLKQVFFLGNGNWFRFTIIITAVWKEFGFSAIVILAAISGIDPTLYESAYMDGSTKWQQCRYITMPCLVPIMVVVGILSLGNILNADFDQIFNLYNGLVYDKGDIIDTYVYRLGLLQANYSVSAAIGMFKSVVSFIVIIIGYGLAYRIAKYRIF